MLDLAHHRLKVPDGYRERRRAPAKVVGAENNDPPVILPGGQRKRLGDEVRGQQVVRHGQTGDAVGQGGALGQAHGPLKSLGLGIKGRKGCQWRGRISAAAGQDKQHNRQQGSSGHSPWGKGVQKIALPP